MDFGVDAATGKAASTGSLCLVAFAETSAVLKVVEDVGVLNTTLVLL